ncbi:MAG: hypothetical protein DUD32_09225 [Lactobacillus sp.]|nr:MAG: hypothetical protein DUD32_09225 [Lactobacillus sp.]
MKVIIEGDDHRSVYESDDIDHLKKIINDNISQNTLSVTIFEKNFSETRKCSAVSTANPGC